MPEIPPQEDLYGWLVGSWELDVLHYWAMDVSACWLHRFSAMPAAPSE